MHLCSVNWECKLEYISCSLSFFYFNDSYSSAPGILVFAFASWYKVFTPSINLFTLKLLLESEHNATIYIYSLLLEGSQHTWKGHSRIENVWRKRQHPKGFEHLLRDGFLLYLSLSGATFSTYARFDPFKQNFFLGHLNFCMIFVKVVMYLKYFSVFKCNFSVWIILYVWTLSNDVVKLVTSFVKITKIEKFKPYT